MSSQSPHKDDFWKTHKYQDRIPVWKSLSYKRRKQVKDWTANALLGLVIIAVLFPIFWMFSSALRPRAEMFSRGLQLLPETWTLQHYYTVLFEKPFPTYIFNSIVITTGVVIITMVFSTLGGYGLSRIQMPFKRTYARAILIGYMFPSILLAIPMYIFWRELGLINSLFGATIAIAAKTIPIGLWFMWKFFQRVPYHLEESAQMSGATRFRAFKDVALPRAKPGIIAVSIIAFAIAWGEFTIPKILLPAQDQWVLTVSLQTLSQFNTVFWGELMAVMTLTLLPGLVILLFLQKHLLTGLRY